MATNKGNRKGFKAMVCVVLASLSVLLSACGNPGGSCQGADAIGHLTECAYRVTVGK